MNKAVNVVDLFAGPGGLGEGFSSCNQGKTFKILISAEMEPSAHQTLKLRSFYRLLKNKGNSSLQSYYQFCNGESDTPYDSGNLSEWKEAENEARCLTLGSVDGNRELDMILNQAKLNTKHWVLIGGPPCQAYSLVGRARNRGKIDYRPDEDHRHYLYREYLRIINQYQPSIFVMENVKGILSSTVNGQNIFKNILLDLSKPEQINNKKIGYGYKIYSLVSPTFVECEMDLDKINVNDFIIRSEEYGIPQARHRVILLGIRDDIKVVPNTLIPSKISTVENVIGLLPALRSRISKESDSNENWAQIIKQNLYDLYNEVSKRNDLQDLASTLHKANNKLLEDLSTGGLRLNFNKKNQLSSQSIHDWYHDNELKVWLNHEARGHMRSDLKRYLYTAAYGEAYGRSPKGHKEFELEGLRPNHANWETGKFADRFRVQIKNKPSTTITSHISKDGHYFIHPDLKQCRSLTVREAARLQTFPDNYFFQGNRTQQYHQVGNAVPPLLAYKIAVIISDVMQRM